MSRFQFVADNSDHFAGRGGVKRLCELVEIERSSYYAWLNAAPARAARAAADAELADRIRAIHAGDNTIGAPRMTAELNDLLAAQQARDNAKQDAKQAREAEQVEEAEALLVAVLGATPLDGNPRRRWARRRWARRRWARRRWARRRWARRRWVRGAEQWWCAGPGEPQAG